ncbi:glycogen debranching enzyme [Streptacidiphilus sp. MAP12-20]|uniref:glycogen debranching N-terminal domain-containing protein n=1 Tax=Streptacidiphilus sp. MAP12-20 TaxID=3156299 RepID=UPI0035116B21
MFESDASSVHGARQPLLHQAAICVAAPSFAVSAADGQLRGLGADGFFDRDRRLVARLLLTVDEREPEAVGAYPQGPDRMRFVSVLRYADDPTSHDPSILVERIREARGVERLRIRNLGQRPRRVQIMVEAATDLAGVEEVRKAAATLPAPATAGASWLSWERETDGLRLTARLSADTEGQDPPSISDGPEGGCLSWPTVLLPAGGQWQTVLRISGGTTPAPRDHPDRPSTPPPWTEPALDGDRRLAALVRRGLADLDALRLADPLGRSVDARGEVHEDQFVAAGCPWYLTLFGRDSIWAARMLLPLGTRLAHGTLWTLARRQGTQHDGIREEAPGRILHELRTRDAQHSRGLTIPARYYGSIDATPLFVSLLVDAWRWGLAEAEVAELLPYAERAMQWIISSCARDEAGLLRYHGSGTTGLGRGLTHHGWKDSDDAIRDALGRQVPPPLALCEVQGYAYEAATGLAELLAAFGRTARAAELDAWAATLRKNFHDAFWVPSADGPAHRYPAIAVGRGLVPVTGPASNMGHLLATGILGPDDCRDVAAWLASPGLESGWGLRSRSAALPGFNPLSYHGGAVWPHDTAIAVHGLCRTGHFAAAGLLADGLLEAAAHFQYRVPELYCGEARVEDTPAPLDYPAACRPQAWSAASGVALLSALLGLHADAPRRTLGVRPAPGPLAAPLTARGLRLADREFDVLVNRDGMPEVQGLPPGWRVAVEG